MLMLFFLLRETTVELYGRDFILFVLKKYYSSFPTNEESENGMEICQFPWK